MRCSLRAALLLAIMMLMNACAGIPKTEATKKSPLDVEMVPVKGGCFKMGDEFGVGRVDEKPVHEVCLDDFSIGRYEVTQAQWTAVMGSNPSVNKECGPDCPVENVSWIDIREFINLLNQKTGKTFRLPTEAEWEYAARSGGKQEAWTGTNDTSKVGEYAWFEENSEGKIHPVGTKKPNALGIYDMTGNVWEWCKDVHMDEYYKMSPNKNPQGPEKGQSRVTRGGSNSSTAWHARIANRGRVVPQRRNEGLGFRLALPNAQ